MKANEFYVTDMMKGQKQVAGVPNPGVGEIVQLTAEQAAHPLRQGHISKSKGTAKKADMPENKPEPKEDDKSQEARDSSARNKR